jgi:hypothetical protein
MVKVSLVAESLAVPLMTLVLASIVSPLGSTA